MAAVVDVPGDHVNWNEFCDKHAKSAASNIAKAFACFVNNHGGPESGVEHKEFLTRFIDCFVEHFEVEFKHCKDNPGGLVNGETSLNGFRNLTQDEHSDYFDQTAEQQPQPQPKSPKFLHRPFFRRLSFKALKKGKGFFYRQVSDETDSLASGSSKNIKLDKNSKTRLAKIVVECRKEGIVNYLVGENADGTHKWEKCRLALVKTVGGYMLEFYSPPKSLKPKSGVFCFLIRDARETTDLEMPDYENTFVLKAENNIEYIIEAHDVDDMRSWLATVKYCMRSQCSSENADTQSLLGSISEGALNKPRSVDGEDPPELPPRLQEALSSSSNFELCSSHVDLSHSIGPEVDLSVQLQEYPWFHGTLPRSEAASLVLNSGPTGHGVFLVRQSETRKGEFVLTFNFHGRAKHLRMTINDAGQCRVQHLNFESIFDMLEHFRLHAIPLESGGTADVTLTHFVVVVRPLASSSARSSQNSNSSDRRPPPTPEQREIVINGGSIRTRTESMERIQENGSGSSVNSVVGGRAIENTYSFV